MYYKTSIPNFDLTLGGGVHSGKIYEIFGYESTGKSTLAEFFAISFLRSIEGGRVLWIESEFALDQLRYKYMGGDLDKTEIHEESTVEGGFGKMRSFIDSTKSEGVHGFVVWDTIAAAVLEDPSGGLGGKAKYIRSQFRDLCGLCSAHNVTIVFVNQVYEKINSMGSPIGTPGGLGIKFHASVRMKVRKAKRMTSKVSGMEIEEASIMEVKTVKNKLMYPNLLSHLYMHNERGVLIWNSVVEFLKNSGLASVKSGGWASFSYGGASIKFQKGSDLVSAIEKEPLLWDLIKLAIYRTYSSVSPLIKIRMIDMIRELENSVAEKYGLEPTELTEEEMYLAGEA